MDDVSAAFTVDGIVAHSSGESVVAIAAVDDGVLAGVGGGANEIVAGAAIECAGAEKYADDVVAVASVDARGAAELEEVISVAAVKSAGFGDGVGDDVIA